MTAQALINDMPDEMVLLFNQIYHFCVDNKIDVKECEKIFNAGVATRYVWMREKQA